MARSNAIDVDWLAEHYPTMTDINELIDDYEHEYGWRPSKTSMYVRANRMGLRKAPVDGRENRAERTVYWSKEPEMEAWMLENDKGQRIDLLVGEFRERWGFGLSRGQVNLFRASHGTQKRRDHGGGRHPVPVGTERVGKDGYIVRKVRERASVPMSKDNWMLKHVWAYEQAYGPVPDGHVVYFADRDRRNFDPENLVAVPRKLVGIMNNDTMPEWYDRESLKACIAIAEIKSKARELEMTAPCTCEVCGRTFVPDAKQREQCQRAPKTCRACLDKGLKARGSRKRWRTLDHDAARKLHADGMTIGQIAEETGASPSTVRYAIYGRKRSR